VPEAVAAAVVVIVATAVTTKYVAVRAKNVAQIQVLIAADLMTLAVKAPAVVRAGSVVQEVIAVKMIKSAVTVIVVTRSCVKTAILLPASVNQSVILTASFVVMAHAAKTGSAA